MSIRKHVSFKDKVDSLEFVQGSCPRNLFGSAKTKKKKPEEVELADRENGYSYSQSVEKMKRNRENMPDSLVPQERRV